LEVFLYRSFLHSISNQGIALPILTSGLQGETLFPVMVAKLEERRCRA